MTTETSPSSFVQRFREYAAGGSLYPQTEGSPLLELSAGGRVLYLLDRSGPYAARPGPAQVLVSAALTRLERGPSDHEQLSSQGVSALEGVGQLRHQERGTLVLHARLPLVLSVSAALLEPLGALQLGDWLTFSTDAPLHGFVL